VLVSAHGFQPGLHRYSAENEADPGVIPDDLAWILFGLTQMEEMLCSLASPCFLMWVSKGGQYKSRGNVITFSQDIAPLCTTLPRIPEQLDVLVVRKPGARNGATYRDFRVRKNKVLAFLRYLKNNNPYYANITLRPSDQVDLPIDGDVLERLPHVESSRDAQESSEDTDSETPSEGGATFVPDTLSEEHNAFVPNFLPRSYEVDALENDMQQIGMTPTSSDPLPWPAFGPALSEYTTDGLFTQAFPSLFPLGKADFSIPRPQRLELFEWAKHLIRYRDDRFATHPRFRFFALNLIFRHRAMSRGKFLFSRNVGGRNMTVGQLKQSLAGQNGDELAEKIVRCVKTVRGTRPFWALEGAKLRDMLDQIGTPTFFYTLSMADMSWPDLHKLMPEDPFEPGLSDSQSYNIRARNVANYPHVVACYLSTRHRYLRETVFQHLGLNDDCAVEDFWFRVEWQSRGSGVLVVCPLKFSFLIFVLPGHIHGFLWLKNANHVDTVDWSDPDDVDRLRRYFDQFLTAFNPEPRRPRPPNDCLFEDFADPHKRADWDLDDDYINLCNRCQTHGSLIRGTHRCNPAQCHRNGSCRFHFPYPLMNEARAFVEGSGSRARKTFAAVRNDPWLNQHARVVLLGWRANVDMQPVLDREAARRYISKYASKPETLSDSYHTALKEFCARLPVEQPAARAVQSLFARMAADRDISAQEAVHLLLGEPLVGCSRSFINLNGQADAARVIREPLDLDDDDDAFEEPFFAHYQIRPAYLGYLNAVQFCMEYSVSRRMFFTLSTRGRLLLIIFVRKRYHQFPSETEARHSTSLATNVIDTDCRASSFRRLGAGTTPSVQAPSFHSRTVCSNGAGCF
jgi:ATP-dependent DNA helicase PIF1